MRYSHRFQVKASVPDVADFHSRAASLRDITPPPVIMRLHSAPDVLGEGAEMDFTMWLGPLPVRWLARIEQVSPSGFVDTQQHGPFRSWVHTHRFVAIEEGITEVQDDVEASIGGGMTRRIKALLMWAGLPLLFAYRGWKTRRLLET